MFLDKNLILRTKKMVYEACVLSVLLYGAECWVPLRRHRRRSNSFHNWCIRIFLGVSNWQQWSQRITMAELRRRWGDEDTTADKVHKRRLEWLGHLARMEDHRRPKFVLFGCFPPSRPRCGPKLRWRDVIRSDLKEMKVKEEEWYKESTESRRN